MQEISYCNCILKYFINLISEAWVYFQASRGSSLHLSHCSGKAWDVCTITGTLQCLINCTWVGVSFPVNAGLPLLIRSETPWLHKAKAWPDQQTQIWIKWVINPFYNSNCKLALVVPTLILSWLPNTSAPTAPSGLGSSSFSSLSLRCWLSSEPSPAVISFWA